MSFAFTASPYNSNEDENNGESSNSTITYKKEQRNKTLRKSLSQKPSPKVTEMLNTINNSNDAETYKIEDTGDHMANFNPPVYPQSTVLNKTPIANNDDTVNNYNANYNAPLPGQKQSTDNQVTVESFNNLPNTYSNDYYKQYVPYYNQISQGSGGSGNKDQLLEKLNYMIHLLEEQKDEKTGHIMEELILYSFLGVFMIFIVDSFARAGKYVR